MFIFDLPAKLLSSIATFVFPVFASYKALQNRDGAQQTVWLMYWVVLACVLLVESWFEWVLVWIPFYTWFRALFFIYLVLPQTQGASLLYQRYIHPFLVQHETRIDRFLVRAEERARAAGLDWIHAALAWVKKAAMMGYGGGGGGQRRPASGGRRPSPGAGAGAGSFIRSLLAPAPTHHATVGARAAAGVNVNRAPGAGGATGFESAASVVDRLWQDLPGRGTTARSSTSPGAADTDPDPDSSSMISYLTTQRDRINGLLGAYGGGGRGGEMKAVTGGGPATGVAPPEPGPSSMRKIVSELDFERVERGAGEDDDGYGAEHGRMQEGAGAGAGAGVGAGGAAWLPWNWSGGGGAGRATAAGSSKKAD
ncbi:MAG: hypothetical protein M1826_006104 [Phylliscum demangeonii]|nr:MAG: hypothetical protein M1826_006104 [Phylliscum demangeonii]